MLRYLLLLLFIPFAYSTTITPIVVLSPQKKVGEVIITNDTHMPQNYLLSVDETSFPDKTEKLIANNSNDLKLSQTMLYLSPGKEQKIQVLDRGNHEHERYFLLKAQEQISKKNQVYATAIATRIFVRPNKPNFIYNLDGNRFRNDSNGYVMLMVDEECGAVERETKLIKPGDSYNIPKLNLGALVSVEFMGEVKYLIDQCKK